MRQFFTRKKIQLIATPPVATTTATLPTSVQIPWQRIVLSMVGIIIIMFMWRWATFHLYALPPTSITAFTSITNNSLYVIGALVIFFTTGRLIYEWKNSTVSQVIQQTQSITEEHTERVIPPKNFDDPSIS